MTCRICQKPERARGLCATCYQRKRRRGLGMKPMKTIGGKVLQVMLPKGTSQKVAHAAELRGVSVSQVVRETLLKVFGP